MVLFRDKLPLRPILKNNIVDMFFTCIQKTINLQPLFFYHRGQEQKSDDDNDRDGARIGGHHSPDSEHRLSKSLRSPNYEERNTTRDRCVFLHCVVHAFVHILFPTD